ncbi:uncharacterized protein DS421_3g75490 [Arachis hypogaea]|nr:uncharacterized protein DS421_3g75490 [Arachis hypogaea]
MTTGSRSRSSGLRGHGRGQASTESPRAAQSSPSTPTTSWTIVTSQASPVDQQFIMIPNPNYVPPFAMPPADTTTMSTKSAVVDSSNAPSRKPLHYRPSSG